MPVKILMPALSPTMEDGTLAKWLKKEGDTITAGDVIAEIETDKATMEVEAVDEGVLAKILISEGSENVPVNNIIAVLLEEGEENVDIEEFLSANSSGLSENTNSEIKAEDSIVTIQENKTEPELSINDNSRVFASPLAKRIASMKNIDLSSIIGSGPHGRIVKSDLENTANNSLVTSGSQRGHIVRNNKEYELVSNNNMRKVIAKRLTESKQNVPHFYLSIECNMDAVLDARAQINNQFGNDKTKKLSVNDFVILASAKALKDTPEANASWTQDSILMYNNIDISVAVAIDGGLITPIIKNADQKDLQSISAEMKNLAKRAKENNLKPEEFQGGGFSISNLGMYGVKSFNAIVNPPQACILSVGASSKRPVVIDDEIKISSIMDVNISCDHRVVDGAVAASFLGAFKKYIESPVLMLI